MKSGHVKQNIAFTLLLLALACAALISLAIGARRALQPGNSMDFNAYAGARLLLEGKNPYLVWLKGWDDRFMLAQGPMCLPHLFYLLFPFALFDWPAARCLWMITNMAMACYFAWLLYDAQRRPGNNAWGLLLALLFLSSNPVRNVIGNGQSSLLILLGTLLALGRRSQPLLSGVGLGISMAKYSFGAFFLAAELGRRRIVAVGVAGVMVLAGYVGLAVQTHSQFNLGLLAGPTDALKLYPSFEGHFLWLHRYFGDGATKFFPVLGLAVVLACTLVLASANFPPGELDMKLACGVTFASLLFAPHHSYDFVMLALPLALGCRLEQLKKFERYLYGATLLTYWNFIGPLNALRNPLAVAVKDVVLVLALVLLTCIFLAKISNRPDRVENRLQN